MTRTSYTSTRITARVILSLLLLFLCPWVTASGNNRGTAVKVRNDRMLQDREFHHFDRGWDINVAYALPREGVGELFETLLRIESTEKDHYNLILAVGADSAAELLWNCNSEIERIPLRLPPGAALPDTLRVGMVLRFPTDSIDVTVNDGKYVFHTPGMTVAKGYRFETGDGKLKVADSMATSVTERRHGQNVSPWFWFILVLAVDLVAFLLVHHHRKKQKKLKEMRRNDTLSSLKEDPNGIVLPKTNAIYLFGDLKVYDNEGADIAVRMSPLLRELFVLLALKSPDNGISTEELTNLLWFDKDEKSAKNNRSVNFSKLRTLLESVVNTTIVKNGGKWRLEFNKDTFVDYKECMQLCRQPERLSPDKIDILATLVSSGSLLSECDYLWLDPFKSRISETVINALMKYVSTLDAHEDYRTRLLIADIIFRFDFVNEEALRIKCRGYLGMRKHYMARSTYDHFCKEYQKLYGEPYAPTYNQVISEA